MERPYRLAAALALTTVAGCAGTHMPPQNPVMRPVAATGTSERPAANAPLLDTTWKILSMAGEPVTAVDGKRRPQILLRSDGWSATVGCNQMSGGLSVSGERVAFKSGMSTLMACPPPLDVLEKQLGKSLLATTHWRIQGNRLELRDDAGVQTFLCEAAHSG